MDQGKTYQVTYKVYPNTKIKQVNWHGKLTYPLYVQMIFDRRNTVYKCNLFDLYLKPKYGLRVAGELHPPRIEEVIRQEEELIEFIINKHPYDFSFELFKKDYDYYSRDLLDETEPGFLAYLHTFFQDEGMPYLADLLINGSPECHASDAVRDMKNALKPDLYNRLIENSFSYAPPYLPLFQFAQSQIRPRVTSLVSLILKDWEMNETKEAFSKFIGAYFPSRSLLNVLTNIEKYNKV